MPLSQRLLDDGDDASFVSVGDDLEETAVVTIPEVLDPSTV
jgi:hypothetical protein